MNLIWIMLWVSTGPSCEAPGAIEWTEHYSVRASSTAMMEWKETLQSRGKGFAFQILKAEVAYVDPKLDEKEIQP